MTSVFFCESGAVIPVKNKMNIMERGHFADMDCKMSPLICVHSARVNAGAFAPLTDTCAKGMDFALYPFPERFFALAARPETGKGVYAFLEVIS